MMLGVFITILFLFLGGFAFSIFSNKKIELTIPIYSLVVIVFLYLFYILNIINVGYYLLIFLTVISLIIGLVITIKKKELLDKLKLVLTPGLLVLFIVSIIIFFIVRDNKIMYFDELRMWSAYPKTIFFTGKLALPGNDFMQTSYFPGMPLWQYFVEKNNIVFSNAYLFWGYSIIMVILLLPLFYKVEWKRFYLIIPCILLCLFFPMIFANSGFDCLYYYKSLFIDPALGFGFGFSFWLATRDLKKSKMEYLLFCLSLCVTMLFKITAVVMIIPVFCTFILFQLFVYKNIKIKKIKELMINILLLIIPLLSLASIYFSWSICVNYYNSNYNENITETKLQSLSPKMAWDLVVKPEDKDIEFRDKYIKEIKETPLLLTNVTMQKYLTVRNMTIIYVILFVMIFVFSKEGFRLRNAYLGLIGLGIIFVYMLFYYVIYTLQFHRVVLCYGRYISPVFGGLSFFILLYLVDNKDSFKYKSLYYFIGSLFIPFILFNSFNIDKSVYRPDIIDNTQKLEKELLNKVNRKDKERLTVLTVQNTCDTIYYTCVLVQHHMYYNLIDDNILVSEIEYMAGVVDDVTIYDDNLVDNYKLLTALEGIDYLIVTDDIDVFKKEDAKLFGTDKLSFGSIYKINNDGENYSLELIQ